MHVTDGKKVFLLAFMGYLCFARNQRKAIEID